VECAIEQEDMDFLKFIWENQALTIISKNAYVTYGKDSNKKSLKNKYQSSVRRKSMFEVNMEEGKEVVFNNGYVLFTLSFLINKICKLKSRRNNNIQ
jgi:hypothetical protein